VYWPWIPEPGKWAQCDFSDGPIVGGIKTTLFHYYLPYSRYRIVLHIRNQSHPNVIGALHTCFVMVGGVPRYVLTDNAKTAATTHVAGVAVLNTKMVKFAAAYGFSLWTCVPYDPDSKGRVERAVRVAKEHLCPRDTKLLDDYESLEQLEEAIGEFNREINGKVHASSGKILALCPTRDRSS
jgi:transposase